MIDGKVSVITRENQCHISEWDCRNGEQVEVSGLTAEQAVALKRIIESAYLQGKQQMRSAAMKAIQFLECPPSAS